MDHRVLPHWAISEEADMENDTSRFGGVDWATDAHAVAVVDQTGAVADEFEVDNSGPGLEELCRRLVTHRVARVAIERPDGPVVEALLGAGFEVVVVPSRSVKALRERYGLAGNKSDRRDAYVLADCLRTDGHRWRSLESDSPATVTLRSTVRARRDLVETRVALANQLRAHFRVASPGAVGLFRDIDSPISLRFLERFPSATKVAWLSEKRLGVWLKANGYSGRKSPVDLYRRLREAPGGPQRRRDPVQWYWPSSRCSRASGLRSTNSPHASPSNLTPTPTPRSSRRFPGPVPCGPPLCWPRSVTAGPGSPIPRAWPAWREWLRRLVIPDVSASSSSAGAATRSSETHCVTSQETRGKETRGRNAVTESCARPRATPTPPGSSLDPGSRSSGVVGRTGCPTTQPCHGGFQRLSNEVA